jgi:hypothetical protein
MSAVGHRRRLFYVARGGMDPAASKKAATARPWTKRDNEK